MSIASEISRIQGEKNNLRTKLVELGLAASDDDLEALVTAVEGIIGRGAVSGSISTKSGIYTVPAGYHNGTGKVGIASTEQAKILPENIKNGIEVLGVTGDYEGEPVNLQGKTVTPTKSSQSVSPDSGYDGLSGVTVNAIPAAFQNVTGVTATAEDVLANKVIVDASGEELAGTMVNNGAVAESINGTTITFYTIPAGYHDGSGTVALDGSIEAALAAI